METDGNLHFPSRGATHKSGCQSVFDQSASAELIGEIQPPPSWINKHLKVDFHVSSLETCFAGLPLGVGADRQTDGWKSACMGSIRHLLNLESGSRLSNKRELSKRLLPKHFPVCNSREISFKKIKRGACLSMASAAAAAAAPGRR